MSKRVSRIQSVQVVSTISILHLIANRKVAVENKRAKKSSINNQEDLKCELGWRLKFK
jgi:hypothetical protein